MKIEKSRQRHKSYFLIISLFITFSVADIACGTENVLQINEPQWDSFAVSAPASNEIADQNCTAVSSLSVDAQQAEQEVIAAAQKELTTFLELIREGSELSFGFQDKVDLEQATIGNSAYQMYTRCQGIDYPTNVWRVPVVAVSKTRAFLIVDWVDNNWQVVGLGGAEFAKQVSELDNEIISRKSFYSQMHRIIIRDYQNRTDFLLLKSYAMDHQLEQTILNFPEVIQEHNEWCWAGVSAALFDYFGNSVEQCEIAEYTRTVALWHDFGPTECCISPDAGCNYWNYNWGYAGSIEDILENMQETIEISNYGVSRAMTVNEIEDDLGQDLPFVIRWGWDSGGGHFLVGFGLDENPADITNPYLHYMNPWFGEGNHIALYLWVDSGGGHTWTHTNRLSSVFMYGDIDGSKHLELSDVIVVLQLMTGTPTISPLMSADANGDFKIGMAETLYLLRRLAE